MEVRSMPYRSGTRPPGSHFRTESLAIPSDQPGSHSDELPDGLRELLLIKLAPMVLTAPAPSWWRMGSLWPPLEGCLHSHRHHLRPAPGRLSKSSGQRLLQARK